MFLVFTFYEADDVYCRLLGKRFIFRLAYFWNEIFYQHNPNPRDLFAIYMGDVCPAGVQHENYVISGIASGIGHTCCLTLVIPRYYINHPCP